MKAPETVIQQMLPSPTLTAEELEVGVMTEAAISHVYHSLRQTRKQGLTPES